MKRLMIIFAGFLFLAGLNMMQYSSNDFLCELDHQKTVFSFDWGASRVWAATSPEAKIIANGEKNELTLKKNDQLSISISIDPGFRQGEDSDLWIFVETPYSTPYSEMSYVFPSGWEAGIKSGSTVPLSPLKSFEIFDEIPQPGTYNFHIVLTRPGGRYEADVWSWDMVEVNVLPWSGDPVILTENDDALVNELSKVYEVVEPGSDIQGPVFISDMELIQHDSHKQRLVYDAFYENLPLVLVRPDKEAIGFLSDLLDISHRIIAEPAGNELFYGLFLNDLQQLSIFVIQGPDKYLNDMDLPLLPEDNYCQVFDGKCYNDQIQQLRKWLIDSSAKQVSEERYLDFQQRLLRSVDKKLGTSEKARELNLEDGDGVIITKATNWGGKKCITKKGRKKCPNNRNHLQVTYYILPIYSEKNAKDYILVKQNPSFNASAEAKSQTDYSVGFYGRSYKITNTLQNKDKKSLIGSHDIQLIKHSLSGTISKTMYEEGFSWGIGGALSLGGSQVEGFKGSGEFSIGANWNSNISYSIEDVTRDVHIKNHQIGMEYKLKRPETKNTHWHSPALGKMSDISKSTFTPELAWVWQIDPRIRNENPQGLRLGSNVETVLGFTTADRVWFFFEMEIIEHKKAKHFDFDIQLGWPIKPGIEFHPEKVSQCHDNWDFAWRNMSDEVDVFRYFDFTVCDDKQALSLTGIDFSGANLQGAVFDGKDMIMARLNEANLAKTSFKKSKLENANFRKAQIIEANFEGAYLRNANFYETSLRDVSFKGADLRGTNFGAEVLHNVDMRNANLEGATFKKGQYFGNIKLEGATWTDGTTKCDFKTKCPPEGKPSLPGKPKR